MEIEPFKRRTSAAVMLLIATAIALHSYAAEPTAPFVPSGLTLGDQWTVRVRQYQITPKKPKLMAPIAWDYTVVESALIDGEEAWHIAISERENNYRVAGLFVSKADGHALRLETYSNEQTNSTDYVTDDGSPVPVTSGGAIPPTDYPYFGQTDQEMQYEYVPVLNGLWGFPQSITQYVADSGAGAEVRFKSELGEVVQVWESGKPWWVKAEMPGVYVAEAVRFRKSPLAQFNKFKEAERAVDRGISAPTDQWWPMSGEASTSPWSPEDASAKASSQALQIPWSGYWWPKVNYNDVNKNTYAPGGLLYKYDEYFRTLRGAYPSPKTRDWEIQNFSGGLAWEGHCDGWSAAAVLYPEPRSARTCLGTTLDVGDLKGLLTVAYKDSAYTWLGGSSANDSSYLSAYQFHSLLVQYLGIQRKAMVFDAHRYSEVWNYPAYRYDMTTRWDSQISNRLHVTCTVTFASDGVAADSVGTTVFGPIVYYYYVTADRNGNPINGTSGWEGGTGNYSIPDFIWLPVGSGSTQRPFTGSERTYNPAIDWNVVSEMVGYGAAKVTYPNSNGMTLRKGTAYNIAWSSFAGSSVNIDLYQGASRVSTIATATPNDGSYSWTVPTTVANGSTFRVRVTSASRAAEFDVSDYFFTINSGTSANTYTGSLATSDPKSLRKTSSYADRWTFTLTATTTVQIDMVSSFDNFVALYAGSTPSAGSFIAEFDDYNGSNARLSRTLGAGTYCIEATSFSGGATGSYTLSSNVRLTAVSGSSSGGTYSGSLATSDRRSVTKTSSYTDVWTFTLTAKTTVRINMTSTFDNYLNLFSGTTPSSSARIGYNDDTNGNNASLYYTLNPGTYCIESTSYYGSTTGSYTLSSTVSLAAR